MDTKQRVLLVNVSRKELRSLFNEQTQQKAFRAFWTNENMSRWACKSATPMLNCGLYVYPEEEVEVMIECFAMYWVLVKAVQQQVESGGKKSLSEEIYQVLSTCGQECAEYVRRNFGKEQVFQVVVNEKDFRGLFNEPSMRRVFDTIWESQSMSIWVCESATPKLNKGPFIYQEEGVELMAQGAVMYFVLVNAIEQQVKNGGKKSLNEEIYQVMNTHGQECAQNAREILEEELKD